MATVSEALAIALHHHQAGRLQDAEQIYRQILAVEPDHVEALHLFGAIAHQVGRHELAIEVIRRAIRLQGNEAVLHNNLGEAHRALRDIPEAVACYRRALELDPEFADAHYNLGLALHGQRQLDDAAACYRRALELKPHFAEAHNNLGNVLREQRRLDEAAACYRRALELKPDCAEAYNNLGCALKEQARLDDAVACYRRALELKPNIAEVHNNLGNALKALRKLDDAVACYRRALELKPDYADAHKNLAIAWLLAGDWQRGWPEYEWRRQATDANPRRWDRPLWNGEPLAGKTILLHAEQGLGDTILFVRYASVVKQLGGTVVVECQKALLGLLEGCPGVDQLVEQGADLPAFDLHAPLLSVPGILKTSIETIPAEIPYLFPKSSLVDQWQKRLDTRGDFKIGIVWQGSPEYPDDRLRSIPLRCFAPVAQIPGVRLVSLQKGPGVEQLAETRDLFAVTDFGGELDERSGPFLDTAAVMKSLDLVIAADTAAAHLAGALGVPVWVALGFVPDWRWLLDREDTPWYPTMRLFRQKEPGNWHGVFQQIAAALSERLSPQKRKTPGDKDVVVAAADQTVLESGSVRLKRCRYGPMLYLTGDQYIGRSLDRYGEFSEAEADLVRRLIRPGHTIVEIGANMGALTIPLAKATGPQGVVHAVEPQRVIFQILCANVALNALSNVHTYHAAAGRETTTIVVPKLDYAASQNFGGLSLGGWAEGERVPVATIDSLDLPACHVLKVDVEGMEGDVIAGAERTIRRFRPALYVENDRPQNSAALIRQLLALDYRLYWHLPPLFNPRNHHGVAENVFGPIVSINMLGLHASVSQTIAGLREIASPEDDWRSGLGA